MTTAIVLWQPPLDSITGMDALAYLHQLPDNYINCIVTSPPYWGLRDYGVAGQLGLEDSPQKFITCMVEIFREARRVLRDDGICWLNMGDTYASDTKWGGHSTGKHSCIPGVSANRMRTQTGLKPKDLCGIPWRLALALQEDGWYLRSDIIWHKPNPMPESVTDRPTKSHEYVFLLTKSERYWYDADAIREPHAESSLPRAKRGVSDQNKWNNGAPGSTAHTISQSRPNKTKLTGTGYGGDGSKLQGHSGYYAADGTLLLNPGGRNKRTVWTVATESSPYAHFATFPKKLITPMILAGCPPKVCSTCGAPWQRISEKEFIPQPDVSAERVAYRGKMADENHWNGFPRGTTRVNGSHWQPTCDCHTDHRPGIVLDFFGGTGTTGLVAMQHNRHYLMCDLNPEYVTIARERCRKPFEPHHIQPDNDVSELPLFAHVEASVGA